MTAAECLRQYNCELKNIRTYFLDFTFFPRLLLIGENAKLIYSAIATSQETEKTRLAATAS
jgi:hypothetical protein